MAFGNTNDADRDLAAVHADSNLEIRQLRRRAHLLGIRFERLDDAQGSARRAVRIVLCSRRKTEERGNPVSHIGVDDAAELFYRPAHPVDAASHEGGVLAGLKPLRERRRSDHIRKEHAHGPHFVFGVDRRGRHSSPGSKPRPPAASTSIRVLPIFTTSRRRGDIRTGDPRSGPPRFRSARTGRGSRARRGSAR